MPARDAQRRAKTRRACVVSHARNMAEASSHTAETVSWRVRAPTFRASAFPKGSACSNERGASGVSPRRRGARRARSERTETHRERLERFQP